MNKLILFYIFQFQQRCSTSIQNKRIINRLLPLRHNNRQLSLANVFVANEDYLLIRYDENYMDKWLIINFEECFACWTLPSIILSVDRLNLRGCRLENNRIDEIEGMKGQHFVRWLFREIHNCSQHVRNSDMRVSGLLCVSATRRGNNNSNVKTLAFAKKKFLAKKS